MKKLKDNSGSALLWTVMVLGLLTVFCTTVLTMSMAYSKRNLNQNQNQQAYYTALSAVDLIAKQFNGIHAKDSPQFKIIEKLEQGDIITIDDMDLPPELGSCTVTMQMRNDDIVITADAEKDGMSYRLSGIMEGTEIPVWNPGSGDYGDGSPTVGAGGMAGGAGMQTDPDTDIYIWGNNEFEMDTNGNSGDSIHMGALYSHGPIEIICGKWGNGPYTHLHGEIISTNNIHMSNSATAGLLPEEFFDEQLPNGMTKCCDNSNESFMHTTGKVLMEQESRMGGNITANTIEIKGKARVFGDLTADKVTVSDEWNHDSEFYSVKGNIVANDVTIDASSVIIGDINAQTVTISGTATVTGNITAETVNINNGAVVSGNIIANKLVMKDHASKIYGSVTTGTLDLKDGAVITQDVITDSITINTYSNKAILGNLSYFSSTNDIDSLRGKVQGSVSRPQEHPPALVPPEKVPPVTSQMPPKPAPPPIPPIPTKPPPIAIGKKDGHDLTVGSDEKDTYYIIDHDKAEIKNLIVEGDKNIFIYIPNGYELDLRDMTDSDGIPNVFFLLGSGSSLDVKDDNSVNKITFPIYVWSREGSGAELELGANSSIVGGIWVDKVDSNRDCEFHWKAPTFNDPENPDPPDQPEPPEPPEPEHPEGPEEPEEPEEPEILVNWGLAAYENR